MPNSFFIYVSVYDIVLEFNNGFLLSIWLFASEKVIDQHAEEIFYTVQGKVLLILGYTALCCVLAPSYYGGETRALTLHTC